MCERTFVTWGPWARRSLLLTFATALAACALPPPPDIEPEAGPDAEPDASIDAGIDALPDAEPDSGLLPAQLQLNVDSHDFSDVTVGQSTEPQEFFVQNIGETASGTISTTITGAQASEFTFVSAGAEGCDVGPLQPLQTCKVLVRFSPDDAGARAATVTVSSPVGGSDTISLTGNGLTAGDLELVSEATLAFDTTEIVSTSGTETVTVRNTGESATAPLTVVLADEDNFEITSDGCDGQPLQPLGTCDVVVRFTPSEVGAWTTQLSVRESPTVGVSTALQATATARLAITRTGSGSIVSDPAGLSCGAGCTTQTFGFDEPQVQLTATADSGHVFDSWTGACAAANPSNVCSVSLTTPLTTAGASFRQVYPLVVMVNGEGTVTSAPVGISCGEGALDCEQIYDAGTPVTLSVTPASGWEVYSWTGTGTSCGAGARMCSTTMNQARNVTVELRRQYLVMVMTGGSGAASGTVTGGGITCPGSCSTYAFENSQVTLTESPGTQGGASQARFSGWSGACSGTATTCDLTITGDTTVMATFIQQHRLALTLAGTGTGTVTAGANTCSSGTCNWYYDTGATPSLSTTPGAGSLFSSFSGDCTGSSCSPGMTAPRAVTATFGVARALTVTVTGSGTVTSVPTGINCGTDCTESYLHDTDVMLTVTPAAGWEVYDWGGAADACTAPSHSCSIDMTAARTVTVELRRQWTITVNTSGSGSGSVTTTGLACTTPMMNCTKTVFEGESVTLTQNQGAQGGASQSRFGGWSGACSGTGATCALNNITSNLTVGASSILQYRLAVMITGSGSVTGNGNSCGSGTCNWYYDTGATASLTATASGGALFTGYGGDCAGSSCSLSMSTSHAVSATFAVARHLTVEVTGSGTVTSDPAGISCGTDCEHDYLNDTDVTLTATPTAGWEVALWEGTGSACIAGMRMCITDMTTARTVRVTFRRQWTVTVNATGSGSGTVTGGSSTCTTPQMNCLTYVFEGDGLTLTHDQGAQTGASRNRFGAWSGACTGTGATCALTNITSNLTVGASSILQYRLALTMGGDGGGTVTQGGNTCTTGTCNWYYDTGTTGVALTATPNSSTWFDGFTGDCTGASCSLTMSAARAVGTQFRLMQCTPNTEVCNDTTDHYVDCGPTGLIERAFDCPLECSSTSEKCLDIDPTNGFASYLDMATDGPGYAFTGTSSINTDSGAVNNGGTGSTPPSEVVDGVRIFWFSSMSVAGTLTVTGSNALAIMVDGDVDITGTIDISATRNIAGPGALDSTAGCAGVSPSSLTAGAGGAGRATNGRAGGTGSGGAGGSAGTANLAVVPLRGGCRGGGGNTWGGGGGGALQITARGTISVTASGIIDASGGGGGPRGGIDGVTYSGSGGGSGGVVIFEANQVLVDGAGVIISTKGGAGGGVGVNGTARGEDGGTDAEAAAGGSSGSQPVGGYGGIGAGTATATLPGAGQSDSGSRGAGGGAASGIVHIGTRSGSFVAQGGASMRSYVTVAVTQTRTVE